MIKTATKRSIQALILLPVLLVITSPLAAAEEDFTNALGMRFVRIPAGEFTMGSADLDEILFELPGGKSMQVQDETPAHRVIFPKPFYLGQTEVTQAQWYAVMGTRPGPDTHWNRTDWEQLPVVSVTWHDVQRYLLTLNKRDTSARYRLPTEAEWEYAARAGSQGLRPFPAGELVDHAWYIDNSGDTVKPVATRSPNPWGLHDMLGNVWEWTHDWYSPDYYVHSPAELPQGPTTGSKKIRRGGSYHCPIHLVRPGYRSADTPETRYSVIGFRLIAIPDAPRGKTKRG